MVLIKKYGNRRLYDTESSRYITLEGLGELIKAGAEVRVVGATSNQDLTQATLTQLIMENRGASQLLPVPLLHQLIRLGQDALAEFLSRYVSGALEFFLQARQGAPALNPFQAFSGFNPFFSSMSAPPPPAPPPARPPPPAASPTELDELRGELAELRRLVRKRRK